MTVSRSFHQFVDGTHSSQISVVSQTIGMFFISILLLLPKESESLLETVDHQVVITTEESCEY